MKGCEAESSHTGPSETNTWDRSSVLAYCFGRATVGRQRPRMRVRYLNGRSNCCFLRFSLLAKLERRTVIFRFFFFFSNLSSAILFRLNWISTFHSAEVSLKILDVFTIEEHAGGTRLRIFRHFPETREES